LQDAASLLWGSNIVMEMATGGLFNQVMQVQTTDAVYYLKRFTDTATSGVFPALPTTASQRFKVALRWHEMALEASHHSKQVQIPAVLSHDNDLDWIAMTSVEGMPLYQDVTKHNSHSEDALPALIDWLSALHQFKLPYDASLLAASAPFKEFKIHLQYTQLLKELPAQLELPARQFIETYLHCQREPVHGDLNSRNILIAPDGLVAVIDFEQGHAGEGIYDLAYIVSEYVIGKLGHENEAESLLQRIWKQYAVNRKWEIEGEEFYRWRIHLGFQTLYRLVGPSRQVWTGHLAAKAKDRVRLWSVEQLTGLLK